MKKKIMVGFLALSLMLTGGLVTQAGTSLIKYSVDVPGYNSSGYTTSQTQSSSGHDAYLNSVYVGSYTVDVRSVYTNATGGSSTGSWVRSVTNNRSYLIPNGAGSGKSVRLEFSSNLTTPTKVVATGNWASN